MADIKTLAAGADLLEPSGPRLLDVAAGETSGDLSAVCAGRVLDDASTVLEEGLTHNAVVRLCVRKDANVTVKMRGTKDLEVTLTADETAASLRAKLERMRPGYARDLSGPYPRDNRARDSQLFFGGQELRDGPLNMYGVADGATLELQPHTSGVSGLPIPATFRGSRERHSWNDAAAWNQKPAAAAAGSWVSSASGTGESGRVARFGGAYNDSESSRWSGFGSASSSSSEHHGSPEVARSFDLARRGLAMGNRPQLARGGTGGAYFLRDGDGETCAVCPPRGAPRATTGGRRVSVARGSAGTRVGEGASRGWRRAFWTMTAYGPATSRTCAGKKSARRRGQARVLRLCRAAPGRSWPGTFRRTKSTRSRSWISVWRTPVTTRGHPRAERRSARGHRRGSCAITRVRASAHARGRVLRVEFGRRRFRLDETRRTSPGWTSSGTPAPRAEGIELSRLERVLRVCTVLLQKAARGCTPADIADDVAPDAQPRQRRARVGRRRRRWAAAGQEPPRRRPRPSWTHGARWMATPMRSRGS